jgi:hypothetical protein
VPTQAGLATFTFQVLSIRRRSEEDAENTARACSQPARKCLSPRSSNSTQRSFATRRDRVWLYRPSLLPSEDFGVRKLCELSLSCITAFLRCLFRNMTSSRAAPSRASSVARTAARALSAARDITRRRDKPYKTEHQRVITKKKKLKLDVCCLYHFREYVWRLIQSPDRTLSTQLRLGFNT